MLRRTGASASFWAGLVSAPQRVVEEGKWGEGGPGAELREDAVGRDGEDAQRLILQCGYDEVVTRRGEGDVRDCGWTRRLVGALTLQAGLCLLLVSWWALLLPRM
jgi:hypothetical protein